MRTLSLVAVLSLSASLTAQVRTHTETVRSAKHTFEIVVNGTIDPENIEIAIENAGGVAVKNPRITVNGRYNWYTLEGLVEEITRGARTDEEKVMAIYRFVQKESYWWTYPKDRHGWSPVRFFNTYGYHICAEAAAEFVALCRAAGVEARIWQIWHHTVAEAKWNGAWHHIDADLGIWYLKPDNRTIASMEELQQHPEWVARTYKPYRSVVANWGSRVFYQEEHETAGSATANLYATADDNYIEHEYDDWMYEPASMNIALRPDERLVRWWQPRLRKYYDQRATQEPPRYANGQIVFEPDFGKRTFEGMMQRRNLKFRSEDGAGPAVHVGRLHDSVHDQPSMLSLAIDSPYVIVGGYIDTAFYKGGTAGLDHVSLSAVLDPVLHQSTTLWSYPGWSSGANESRAFLDPRLVKDGPVGCYRLTANYSISAAKSSERPSKYPFIYGGQSGLDRVRMVADLQVNPGSLPALSLGKNTIAYSDETAEPHEVKITYTWRERTDQHAPEAPAIAVAPKDGGQASLAPRLEWSPALDADGDRIANYRVQVSLRPDCAWPVASTLNRDVREGAAFQVPQGWLNANTTYYWRVRAEDEKGNAGPWSPIFRFTTQ